MADNNANSFDNLNNENDDYSLESILAEFKGTAYIDGQRKTNPDLLDERIKHIISDSQDGRLAEKELYQVNLKPNEDFFADLRDEPDAPPVEETASFEEQAASSELPEDEAVEEKQETPEWVLSEEDKKLAAKTAKIDWKPVKAANSFEQAKADIKAFFARRDAAVKVREQELQKQREEEAKLLEQSLAEEPELPAEKADEFASAAENETRPEMEESVNQEEQEILFLDDYRFSRSDEGQLFEKDWEEIRNSQLSPEEQEQKRPSFFTRLKEILFPQDRISDTARLEEEPDEDENEDFPAEEACYQEEPVFGEEAARLTVLRHRLMIMNRAGFLIAIITAVLTLLFERGVYLPGIEDNLRKITILLVVLQLVSMALAVDVLIRGAKKLFSGEAGFETLLLVSSLVCYVSCCLNILGKEQGIPFCAVNAFALAFATWGDYRKAAAMCLSLKTAGVSDELPVLVSSYQPEIDCNIIKKYFTSTAGFYNNLTAGDMAEEAYRLFTPILLCLAILGAVAGRLIGKVSIIQCLNALTAALTGFAAGSVFSVPFSRLAKHLRKSGAAIAGWGAVDTLYYAEGLRLTDTDLFPTGTSVSGVKVIDGRLTDKAIRYTAAILKASGTGVSPAFHELLSENGLAEAEIDGFSLCDNGYVCSVGTTRVLCGSLACMKLYGISVPHDVAIKNAVYTVLDDTLAAVFTLSYRPTKNVQSALNGMLKARIKLFVGNRDFNISPMMIKQKLQISVDDMEYYSTRDAFALSDNTPERIPDAAAVMIRNTPGVLADLLIRTRRLYTVTRINTIISLISAVLGLLIMLVMCKNGNAFSLSPTSLLEYMLAVEAAVLLIDYTV